ncbi:hypothetical protein OE165_27975, partial [Escherichia coli]|uniref:hypothetical protein n=1 Tax=Escherichia coli TaxID=562 RepID=UPI0021F29EC9
AAITEPEVEDVSVSLFSNLYTDHQDQLAYNYAFFDYMEQFGVVKADDFNIALLSNSPIYTYNKLRITKEGIYTNETSWAYIS